jgi:hypothetical protein
MLSQLMMRPDSHAPGVVLMNSFLASTFACSRCCASVPK